jgi:hypothetical protein
VIVSPARTRPPAGTRRWPSSPPGDKLGDGTAAYSGKKRRHGANIQAVTNQDGTIVWFSPGLPGRTRQLTAARDHGVIATCESLNIAVLADRAYMGAADTVEAPIKDRLTPCSGPHFHPPKSRHSQSHYEDAVAHHLRQPFQSGPREIRHPDIHARLHLSWPISATRW